jgi:hypothetical protein
MFNPLTRLITIAVLVGALVPAAVAFPAGAAKGPPQVGPPNDIWTCEYIASHPSQAAAAFVSCDAAGPVIVPGVAPLTADGVDAQPCEQIPLGGGNVSYGVYAWGNLHYFNYYSYSPAVLQSFHYYVQKTNGVTVQHGIDNTTNSHQLQAYNYYYFGAQNLGSSVQHWTWCWGSNP